MKNIQLYTFMSVLDNLITNRIKYKMISLFHNERRILSEIRKLLQLCCQTEKANTYSKCPDGSGMFLSQGLPFGMQTAPFHFSWNIEENVMVHLNIGNFR